MHTVHGKTVKLTLI